MSKPSYLEQLGRHHGFTLAELEANRQGALHPVQLGRGLRKGLVTVAVLTVLGVVALGAGVVGAYVFYDSLGPDPSRVDLNAVYAIVGAGAVLALVFFICARISLVRRRARKAAFVSGRLDVLERPMHKTFISGTASQWIFRVAGRSFHVSRPLWELLTQGAHYRLYSVADQLLSFEPAVAPGGSDTPVSLPTKSVDDPVERAEYERELEHQARTHRIKPSRFVE